MRELRRYDREHGYRPLLLAVDVENDPKTGAFICAGVYGYIRHSSTRREGGKHKRVWDKREVSGYFTSQSAFLAFLEGLKRNACLIVTYNLSYDRVFFDSIIDHSSVIMVQSRTIMLKLKSNGLKVIDLFNHTMMGSLEEWINWLEMPKRFGIVKETLTDLERRVKSDTKATYHLGDFLQSFYHDELGIPMQLTVGASALRLFTMRFFSDYWSRSDDEAEVLSRFERLAYYGGRTELFKRGRQTTYSYDVNSMYLSIMRDCLIPDPSTARYVNKPMPNWREYLDKYEGIWTLTVETPNDMYLPLLPVRVDGKLKFPRGMFTGTWTTPEIRKALSLGYRIIEPREFVYYRTSKLYFHDFAEFIWRKRIEYRNQGNKGMDSMIKRIGNSLYGKFGQRNHTTYFGRVSDYPDSLPDNVQFFEYCGETFVLVQGTENPAKHEFPCISAFITSYARVKLYEGMLPNESTLIYVDTDSLKLTAPAQGIKVSKELGEFGLELEGEEVTYYRPKLYGDKHKGVPKRAVLQERNEEKEIWTFEKPLRYREAIKSGRTPNMWYEVTKTLTHEDDKRVWTGSTSVPLTLSGSP